MRVDRAGGACALAVAVVALSTLAAGAEQKARSIEEANNGRLRVKLLSIEPMVETDRAGDYFGSLVFVQLEVENLTDQPVVLTRPSLEVGGAGATRGGLKFSKPHEWYFGTPNNLSQVWDGKLRAKEKQTILLDYRKIDRKSDQALVANKDARVEIAIAGLKLLKSEKVRGLQQE